MVIISPPSFGAHIQKTPSIWSVAYLSTQLTFCLDLSGYLQYVFNVCIDQRNYVDDLVRKSLSKTKPKPKSVVGFTFNDENAEDAKREETTGTDERNDGDMAVAAKAGTTL